MLLGENITIYPTAKIIRSEFIVSIGSNVIIDDFVFLDGGERTAIGNFVHIAAFTSIMGGGTLIMEDFTGLSGGVRLYTGGEDYLGEFLTNPTVPYPYRQPYRSKIVMRKHSLIGSGCVVLCGPDGLEIGEGASVGALSLVKHDLEPWTVYAGVPARPIRKRDKGRMLELESMLRESLG
jgi:acetyltransferase-like isoleucine patch superfamily enzyme